MLYAIAALVFVSVFAAVCAIFWPRPQAQHLRPLPKARFRPLTLNGYPTPPRADAAELAHVGHVFETPSEFTLVGNYSSGT